MARKPSVNLNLPSGMRVKKTVKGRAWYYLDHGVGTDGKRHWEALGADFSDALRKYAERVKTASAPAVTVPEMLTRWQTSEMARHAPRTRRDVENSIARLLEFFGNPPAPLQAVEPKHIRQYLEWRNGKVQANREIAWFSAAWNWSRGNGLTSLPNPSVGVRRNPERGRDIYIEDAELAAILAHADAPLQEAMELAYLTGQRPGDLLEITEDQIEGGHLHIRQRKTKARLRIEVSGALSALIDRILERKAGISGVASTALIVRENGERMTSAALRSRFDKAREEAARNAPERTAKRLRSIQFRDLRAKAASDLESLERARKLLGHTQQAMTEHYVRARRGEVVQPVAPRNCRTKPEL